MADETRVSLELEPTKDVYAQFESIQKALGHDEPEETFAKLVELGVKAVALTTAEFPEVKMFTRRTSKVAAVREINCPSCGMEITPVFAEDKSYREVAIKLP